MNYVANGAFLVPQSQPFSTLGGKAQQLLEAQTYAKNAGFSFPNAVCVPWTAFAGIASRKGYHEEFCLAYDTDFPQILPADFDAAEKAVVLDILDRLQYPFLSSSAPGEDSFESRMAGLYQSVQMDSLATAKIDHETLPYPKTEFATAADYHQHLALLRAGQVLESYYDLFPSHIRKKHGIAFTGMGILARETVGGERGPEYSLVVQTNEPGKFRVGVTKGFGEKLVSHGEGDFYSISRDLSNVPQHTLDLTDILTRIDKLESCLPQRSGFGRDYELAIDSLGSVNLLQCPPIPMLAAQPKIKKKGNVLERVGFCVGTSTADFDGIVLQTKPCNYSVQDKFLFDMSIKQPGYLLIASNLTKMAPMMAFGAAGIIDRAIITYSGEFSTAHSDGSVVSHYTSLLRSENIPFVHAAIDARKMLELREITAPEIVEGFRLIERRGRIVVDELKGAAGLYLL